MELLSVKEFSFQYPLSKEPVLKNVNMDIYEGEILVICGQSGSGKSTLLKCLKDCTDQSAIVFQDPNTQLVHEAVMDDLAFHMENLGLDRDTMHRRMAETVGFFGMEGLLHESTNALSGGQKQLVVLCGALMTRPRLLLLDEPISQLDPITASELLDMLTRINRELGITVVICEHRLDDVISIADRVFFMKDGRPCLQGKTRDVLAQLLTQQPAESELFVPDISRCSVALAPNADMCLTPRELREVMRTDNIKVANVEERESKSFTLDSSTEKPLIELKDIFFAYPNTDRLILKNLDISVQKGERICLLGGNAAGKSTLLRLMAGILKPMAGRMRNHTTSIGYIPQDVRSFFRFETVEKELRSNHPTSGLDDEIVKDMEIAHLLGRHPYDLSGGEAAKVALSCLLMQKADLIIMDEPTKGMDPYAKKKMQELVKNINATVLLATHDLEFAASFPTRCLMLFDGAISHSGTPIDFFWDMEYYTTATGKAFRQKAKGILTYEDVVKAYVQ